MQLILIYAIEYGQSMILDIIQVTKISNIINTT